jgi:hypothetical protein
LDNKTLDNKAFFSGFKFNKENFDDDKLFECETPDEFDGSDYKAEELFYLRSAAISLKRIADFLSE